MHDAEPRVMMVRSTDGTLQCEYIRSVQEIFVHATYVPFHQLPSVGLPGFFRKFLCTRRTYYFTNYQVWGFPVFSGNFRARDVRAIHQLPSVGLPGNFHARDVRTMLNRQYWGSLRLAPITQSIFFPSA